MTPKALNRTISFIYISAVVQCFDESICYEAVTFQRLSGKLCHP